MSFSRRVGLLLSLIPGAKVSCYCLLETVRLYIKANYKTIRSTKKARPAAQTTSRFSFSKEDKP